MLEEKAPQNAFFDWKVPEWMAGEEKEEGQLCVLRLRYNISTKDFNGHSYLSKDGMK